MFLVASENQIIRDFHIISPEVDGNLKHNKEIFFTVHVFFYKHLDSSRGT